MKEKKIETAAGQTTRDGVIERHGAPAALQGAAVAAETLQEINDPANSGSILSHMLRMKLDPEIEKVFVERAEAQAALKAAEAKAAEAAKKVDDLVGEISSIDTSLLREDISFPEFRDLSSRKIELKKNLGIAEDWAHTVLTNIASPAMALLEEKTILAGAAIYGIIASEQKRLNSELENYVTLMDSLICEFSDAQVALLKSEGILRCFPVSMCCVEHLNLSVRFATNSVRNLIKYAPNFSPFSESEPVAASEPSPSGNVWALAGGGVSILRSL